MMAIKHQSLRIVFAGTPAFGLPCLDALHASQHQLVGIYTQPDRPAGRGKHPQCSAVKTWGAAHHIPVHQPLNFKDVETQNRLAAIKPDLMIVIAYGLILPASVLAIPQFGCINVHASILPRWRGASPIQQALLHGDTKTGITIMQMNEGMDTGEIFTMITTPITSKDNAQSVHDRLSTLSCAPLLETINNIARCGAQTTPQPSTGITYAPKIKKSDAIIHWQTPSSDIDCMIRAFNPWPIAQTYAQHQPLRIHEAHVVKQQTTSTPGTILSLDKTGLLVATAKDCLKITKLQWPGGKVISVADYQNSARRDLEPGTILK